MSKSWIRTILLLAMAVLCLVGAIVMKACSMENAVDAPFVEAESSSAVDSDTDSHSDVMDDLSDENSTEIKVVFNAEEVESKAAKLQADAIEEKATLSIPEEEENPVDSQIVEESVRATSPKTSNIPSAESSSESVSEPAVEPTVTPAPISPTPEPAPEPPVESVPVPPAPESTPEQTPDYADNGWQPEAAEHYHGNGSDAGTCPACGLIYGPAGGAEGQYGEQDGLMG